MTLVLEGTNLTQSPLFSESPEYSQPDLANPKSLLIVAATGLGKTVIMGGLARHWPEGRVMMLSHRFELNSQAIKSFEWICQEDVDLEQASFRADPQRCRIVVASVQSMNSKRKGKYRMERFDPMSFNLLMIDEAHRAAAPTYRRVVSYFKQNPNCVVVGVTATPDRLDKVGLGCVFEEVVCDYNIQWGISNGWLVPPRQVNVAIDGLDLTQVRTVAGDLDKKQLQKIVELEQNLHEMAVPIVDLAGADKKTIVFTASVAQAHRLCEMIRDYHHRKYGATDPRVAVSLDGSMNPQDPRRRQIVEDFKNGGIQFLVNCGVATEGFDAPNVKLIAIGRPTKSRALYVQMLGRGTRPLPGTVEGLESAAQRIEAIRTSDKSTCTIIDFVGQAGRHKLVCTSDILFGETEPDEIIERAKDLSSKKDFDGSSLDAIKEARELIAAEREARRAKVTVGVEYKIREASTAFDLATIPQTRVLGYLKNKSPTEKQVKMLLKLGYQSSQIETMNPRSASAAIDYGIKNPRTNFGKWLHDKKKKEGSL